MPETKTKTTASTATAKSAGPKPQPAPASEPTGRNSYRVIVRSNKDIGNYTPVIFEKRVLQSDDITAAQTIADAARTKAVKGTDYDEVRVKIYEAIGDPEPDAATLWNLVVNDTFPVTSKT